MTMGTQGPRAPFVMLSALHSNKGHNDTLGPKYQCQLVSYVQETEMSGLPFSQCGGLVTKLCSTLCDLIDYILPGSSVHKIF